MLFIKHFLLFIKHNLLQLRRKWLFLPLLILFPSIIIGLIAIILISFITTEETNDPIQVGLVDHDQSEETEMVVDLLADSSELGSFIQLKPMIESEAIDLMSTNELSAYITFPPHFTTHLYEGTSVDLSMIGNPEHPTQSYLIKELIDSVTRHINT